MLLALFLLTLTIVVLHASWAPQRRVLTVPCCTNFSPCVQLARPSDIPATHPALYELPHLTSPISRSRVLQLASRETGAGTPLSPHTREADSA
jgi:hypothetical protein